MFEGRTTARAFCEAGGVTVGCGFVPLVVDGCSEMLVRGTGLSSKHFVMVC